MKKRITFKNLDAVKEATGWARMYYNFDDLDRYDSALILNYLIDTEPVPEGTCNEEGYEDYLRYSDGFIQQKLGVGLTNYIINACLDDLEKHNYIKVHLAKGKATRGFKVRYIKLNYAKLADALEIDLRSTSSTRYY